MVGVTIMSSRFNMPPNKYRVQLNDRLLEFLGNDFNPLLTSVDPPTSLPAKACEILPAIEGSAGRSRKYMLHGCDHVDWFISEAMEMLLLFPSLYR